MFACTLLAQALVEGNSLAANVWHVNRAAKGQNNGTTWVDAFTDLQDALGRAQRGDEIWVASGTYTPDRGTGDREATFRLVSGVALYGGFSGRETKREQRSPALHETILSADLGANDGPRDCAEHSNCCVADELRAGCDNPLCESLVCALRRNCCDPDDWYKWSEECADLAQRGCCHLGNWSSCENSFLVVTASGTDSSTALDGFTVRSAYTSLVRDGYQHFSAGLFCENGQPNIQNCLFTRNSEGGLFARDQSDLTLTNCSFVDNFGLGLAIDRSNPTLIGCRVAHNEGGMMSSGDLVMRDSLFESNAGLGLEVDGHAEITRCTFVDNGYVGLKGYWSASMTVTDCAFLYNPGAGMAGDLWYTTVERCTFVGNGDGALGVSSGTVRNCVFAGNTDRQWGAGAIALGSGSVRNCTFYVNTGARGPGVMALGGSASVSNCVFWGNSNNAGSGESAQIHLSEGARLRMDHNLVQGWTGTFGGVGNFDADPRFVDPLGADGIAGTLDDDLRLMPSSPGINRGNPALQPGLGETDLDGNPRIEGCRVDIGPYESDTLQTPGDFDGNGRFDLADFAGFQSCFAADPTTPGLLDTCLCAFDFDHNGTLNLDDYGVFANLVTGP